MTGELLLKDNPTDQEREQLLKLKREIITMTAPYNFRPTDSKNVLIGMDKTFSALCASIESNGTSGPAFFSCFDFYSRIDFLKTASTPKNK